MPFYTLSEIRAKATMLVAITQKDPTYTKLLYCAVVLFSTPNDIEFLLSIATTKASEGILNQKYNEGCLRRRLGLKKPQELNWYLVRIFPCRHFEQATLMKEEFDRIVKPRFSN
jgi:hypothetical protein